MMKAVVLLRTVMMWGAVVLSGTALLYAMFAQQAIPQWTVWATFLLYGVGSTLPDGKQPRPEDTTDGH
ncbi:hypothetical protein [Schaalia suimastitidis]|uniref:hypothetical protein n=1 Tax=Schaalia suimastitidis TaxID=121163 RepID=UPI00040B1E3A|nr:hypothetical protein [Schaalia suimastitidis]